ncbi:MAG TPA: VWA domain-containing protein [Terrimicrobiaceae bacterium]|nr:VWA domain-containing protein [Terrimicrobiaceae bacterium]
MSFLYPAAFFLSALSLVIVALYLRRPRRRSLEVSTLLFWRRVFERQPHRRFLGRLRNPLSLFLQLLIFLLLLLALARPQEASPRGRRSTVVVLDARARMQAPGVFRDAQFAAQDIVSRLAPNDEVAILALEGPPRIVSPFSNDGKELRQRLASLAPSDAGGDLGETLLLARRLLEARPGEKRLVFISDRKTTDAGDADQIAVGKARENMGILAFAQRALPISPQSAEIFAKVGNFSSTVRHAEIEFSLDGRPFDLQRFQIGPGDQRNLFAIVPKETLARGDGLLVARLTSADGVAFDDTAYGALPTGERLRVLLIGEDDPFLENALKADPSIAVEMLTPDLWRPDMGADFDAVVFDNWLPKDATLETLGRGSFFFFGRTPFDIAGEESPAASLEKTDSESPLLWNVDLDTIRLARAASLSLPISGEWRASVPVESAGEPMIAALEGPQGARVAVAAFAVEDSNFPLRVGFPLFVSNVVHWLAGRRAENETELRAGETFIPVGDESISRDPITQATEDQPPPVIDGPLKLTRNGLYKVRGPFRSRWLAINTADAAESDLRRAEGTTNEVPALSRSWGALQSWRWLALAAAILIVTEWFLHHRRVTE